MTVMGCCRVNLTKLKLKFFFRAFVCIFGGCLGELQQKFDKLEFKFRNLCLLFAIFL